MLMSTYEKQIQKLLNNGKGFLRLSLKGKRLNFGKKYINKINKLHLHVFKKKPGIANNVRRDKKAC